MEHSAIIVANYKISYLNQLYHIMHEKEEILVSFSCIYIYIYIHILSIFLGRDVYSDR